MNVLGPDPCSCGADITLFEERWAPMNSQWRVQHGPNPEHSKSFAFRELFVTDGYAAWTATIQERMQAVAS